MRGTLWNETHVAHDHEIIIILHLTFKIVPTSATERGLCIALQHNVEHCGMERI